MTPTLIEPNLSQATSAAQLKADLIARGCAKHKVVCGIAAGGGKEYREQLVTWGYRMFLN